MNFLSRLFLAAGLAILTAGSVAAQEKKKPPPRIKINSVRPGLPNAGSSSHRVRLGAWNPVYVELEAGEDDIGAGEYELVGETSDGEAQSVFKSAVPAIAEKEKRKAITYYRPGDRGGRITITLRKSNGSTVDTATAEAVREMLDPGESLYVALGAPLGGLRRIFQPKADDEDSKADRSIVVIDSPVLMPTRWFGYQGADVVILSTGNSKFIQGLSKQEPALQALADWVRRGGRLVLSVGRNFQEVRDLLPLLGIRDFTLEKTERVTALPEAARWAEAKPFETMDGIDVVRVSVRDGVMRLAQAEKGDKRWPVLALSTLGLGQVLFVGFDFDSPAFARWEGQPNFWNQLNKELGPRRVEARNEKAELGADLQRALENFEEVPVISFGWVAFFILIYIIIVGPLDYLFLKKVVKRLELTWVTFPLVVLIVSVAAYFTAYKLKGNHMRINKVDVVDISLRDGEVNGTTWMALFSPRVQAYTVGFAPAPEWTGGGKEDDDYGTLVGTMNAPDSSLGGVDRPSTQSFFRRPYSYEPDARGLRGVPVPVWASRSFMASWRTRTDAARLVEAKDFGLASNGNHLYGTIRSNLPVELTEVSLIYRGAAYTMGNLPPGVVRTIPPGIPFKEQQGKAGPWFSERFQRLQTPKRSDRKFSRPQDKDARAFPPPEKEPRQNLEELRPEFMMKPLLFCGSDENPKTGTNNSGLRALDQGWRMRGMQGAPDNKVEKQYLDEAILVGRVAQAPAAAETITLSGVSPTRLWLGTLPGEGERESLQGFLGQDTYVRIYIPVSRESK